MKNAITSDIEFIKVSKEEIDTLKKMYVDNYIKTFIKLSPEPLVWENNIDIIHKKAMELIKDVSNDFVSIDNYDEIYFSLGHSSGSLKCKIKKGEWRAMIEGSVLEKDTNEVSTNQPQESRRL